MGSWGTDVFENDTAMDLLDEVLGGSFRLDDYRHDIRAESSDGYISAPTGEQLLAMGALVRVARGDEIDARGQIVEHAQLEEGTELDLAPFLEQFSEEDIDRLREHIGMTIREPAVSELFELWEESGELEEWLERSRQAVP
jgi:hypothetical protein